MYTNRQRDKDTETSRKADKNTAKLQASRQNSTQEDRKGASQPSKQAG